MHDNNVLKRRGNGYYIGAGSLAATLSSMEHARRKKAAERYRAGKETRKAAPTIQSEPVKTQAATPHQAFHQSIKGILDLPLSDKAKIAAIKAII